jgi:thioesterase domain-containing protein/acyl carrier protein
LVAIWRRILHLDRVGIRDEFTDLGGTSIQAAQLLAQIKSQFGVRMPMSVILDAPNIEQLAERVVTANRGEARHSPKLLKTGKEGGPALFLVHDGDGETFLYLNLARHLPEDVTVYGLEPYASDRCPMLHTTIPQMAAYYVAQTRKACPAGPYFLGGLCAGGTIAFEMALQLRAANQPVGLVALFDAADARTAMIPFFSTRRRWKRFVCSLRGKRTNSRGCESAATVGVAGSRSWLSRLCKLAAIAIVKLWNLAAFEANLRARRIAEAARISTLRTAVERRGRLADDFDAPCVRTIYSHAERHYTPVGKLDAPVLLFRAGADGRSYPADEPLIEMYGRTLFGWDRRVTGGPDAIEVIDVAGGHGGILQDPNVIVISTRLTASIERAVAVANCR